MSDWWEGSTLNQESELLAGGEIKNQCSHNWFSALNNAGVEKVLWKYQLSYRNINTARLQQSETLKEKVILNSFRDT